MYLCEHTQAPHFEETQHPIFSFLSSLLAAGVFCGFLSVLWPPPIQTFVWIVSFAQSLKILKPQSFKISRIVQPTLNIMRTAAGGGASSLKLGAGCFPAPETPPSPSYSIGDQGIEKGGEKGWGEAESASSFSPTQSQFFFARRRLIGSTCPP